MKRFALLAGLVLALTAPAAAQDTPQAEVLAAYSYLRSNGLNANGGNLAIQGNVNNWFSVVGDFDAHFFSGVNLYTYTFGPRFSYRGHDGDSEFVAFGHTLFGGAHASGGGLSANAFAMNLGGGIDWVVHKKVAIRVIQADAQVTRSNGITDTDARLSFGVVFRFGKK